MNILIIFSQPWKVGGAETHVEALIKGLSGHQVFLAVNHGSHNDKIQGLKIKYPYVTIIEIQARGINLVRWWQDLRRLTQLIREYKIDIVSAQQRTAGLWAYRLYKKTGVPFTVTMHDSWHRAQGKKIYVRLFPRMIVVGQHLYKRLVNDFKFLPEQITCIHNGIDFSSFSPQDKQKARQKLTLHDDVLLLHVSRLSTIKGGVAIAIANSVREIVRCIPNARLAIIGEGPLRSQLDDIVEKINIEFGKKVIEVYDFTNEITTWYNAADVVIGEGRVAIEALACEKPVVAIRNGQHFFGAITGKNIAEAIRVNFDGNEKVVSSQTLVQEIQSSMQLQPTECSDIRNTIAHQLSVEHMAQEYVTAFVSVSKGE